MKIKDLSLPPSFSLGNRLETLPDDEVFTPKEIAAMFGINVVSVRRLCEGLGPNKAKTGHPTYMGSRKAILAFKKHYKIS